MITVSNKHLLNNNVRFISRFTTIAKKRPSLLLLPLPVPLLDPRPPLLAPFPRRGAAAAPPPRQTPMPPPHTATIPLPSPIPIIPIMPVPAPPIILLPVTPLMIPLPPMPRARAPTPAPAPAPVIHTAVAVTAEELPPKLPTNQLHMHEIAVTASVTAVLLELPTRGLAEIGDGGEVGDDGAAGVEPPLEGGEGGGGLVLLAELDVNVADHVVGEVVADVEGLDLAELGELLEDVLVEVLEVLLDLAGVKGLPRWVDAGGDHVGAQVHVGEEEGRGDGGAVVQAGAAVPVTARPDLEVEWAVHAVLLGPEDRCQVLCHDDDDGALDVMFF